MGKMDTLSRRQTGKTTFTSYLPVRDLRHKSGEGLRKRTSSLRRLTQINQFRPFVQAQVNAAFFQGMQRGKEIFYYTLRIITHDIGQLAKGITKTRDLDIVYLGTGVIHRSLNQIIQDFISLALFRTR